MLLAIDIDGTLVTGTDAKPTSQVTQAVKEATRNNITVVLATGRPPRSAAPIASALGLAGAHFVCANGSLVGKFNTNPNLPPMITETCELLLRPLETLLNRLNSYAVELDNGTHYLCTESFPRFELPEHATTTIIGTLPRKTTRIIVEGQIRLARSSEAMGLRTETDGNTTEITARGASKEAALEALRKHLRIPHDDTGAVGNGTNDQGMLNWANHTFTIYDPLTPRHSSVPALTSVRCLDASPAITTFTTLCRTGNCQHRAASLQDTQKRTRH